MTSPCVQEIQDMYLVVDETEAIAGSAVEEEEETLQCGVDEDLEITREVADDHVATLDGGEGHIRGIHLGATNQMGDKEQPNAQLLRFSIVHTNR